MSRPTCPQCRIAMNVVGTRIDGTERVRYYGCACGYRADAIRIPLEFAPPRAIAMNDKCDKRPIHNSGCGS